jgi:hypothetical protein
MSNPVMQALLNARIQEEERLEAPVIRVISEKLNLPPAQGDRSAWPAFRDWAARTGVRSYPAKPAVVALFCIENRGLGIDELMRVLGSISAVHADVADPTLGPAVSHAIDRISPIDPPNSWPKEQKFRFLDLPRDLQLYVRKRDGERDAVLNRAQQERAQAVKELDQLKKSLETPTLEESKNVETTPTPAPRADRKRPGRLQCRNRPADRADAQTV